jgi:hypothetical protein
VELRARDERRPIRLVLEVDESDPLLAALPLELAHDGTRFFFKHRSRPTIRVLPRSEARNLHLGPGSRVLIVTAHADGQPEPDRDTLHRHAQTLKAAVTAAGFTADHLPDATPLALRDALIRGPRVDLLYVACHGVEDPDRAGMLALRDGLLSGEELARWLEEAAEDGRQVQAVILCACSSALPSRGQGTLGMAQWLVQPAENFVRSGRALAALGFRGPVGIDWALGLTERLFERLGQGESLEAAFADARYQERDDEPQWVLPILYGRRRDPDTAYPTARPPIAFQVESLPPDLPPLTATPLPRPPRVYFTGREGELTTLREWLRRPGAALISALAGQGGIGKSEIAAVLAHEQRTAGRVVVWLERPDQDIRGTLAALIGLREPGYRAQPGEMLEDLVAHMRRLLDPYCGLLVLDDVQDRQDVERLNPGGSWNVLVTTRTRGLLPAFSTWRSSLSIDRKRWSSSPGWPGNGIPLRQTREKLPSSSWSASEGCRSPWRWRVARCAMP